MSTETKTSDATLTRMHFLMRLAREWDLRFETLLRTGELGKWYSAVGNEALTVGAALALEPGDGLVTLHRDIGAILARSLDADALHESLDAEAGVPGPAALEGRAFLYRLACQMLGRSEGFTEGFDRSYHYGLFDDARGLVHVGMISHLGAMIPVAAGVALAQSMRGTDRVTLNFIGEGGTSTGDFHEGLNMAAVWKLPLVLVIENNGWAFSTPTAEQYACERLADRALGYGIPGWTIDGNDARAVLEVVRDAVARARHGEGPTLIEARLGRMRGHAEGDGSMDVVPAAEQDAARQGDPVARLERELIGSGALDVARAEALGARARELLIDVIDRAAASPDPEPAGALAPRDALAPMAAVVETHPSPAEVESAAGESTYVGAIERGLREEMERDASVFLMGQDIAELGGAFRATKGLVAAFGRERVRNTPIAESGTVGIAAGASLMGLRPVVEMQFADFISCGFNQVVNMAAKLWFRWRRELPLVIRCPYGGGAGAGPFHAQCPEAWFTHAPGLVVVAPAFARDALGLLKASLRGASPVLFFEHKQLYRRVREALPEGEVLVPIGSARVARPGRDVTAVTWGWMVHRTLEAAARLAEDGIEVEVVDLRTLVPLDEETVLESVRRTSKALVVHEAPRTGGFGAEIVARIAAEAFEWLDAPIERVTAPDTAVPYQRDLEAAYLPDTDRIEEALRRLARY